MKVVELIGLPGAGKSTLAEFVKDAGEEVFDNRNAEILVLKRQMGLPRALLVPPVLPARLAHRIACFISPPQDDLDAYYSFLTRYPEYESICARLMSWEQEKGARCPGGLFLAKRMFDLAILYEKIRELSLPGILCLEPGFCMRVTSFFGFVAAPPPRDLVAAYIRAMPRPDMVFLPEAPAALCVQRLKARGRGEPMRLGSQSEAERKITMDNMAAVMTMIPQILEETGVSCVRLNTEQAPETSRKEIEVHVAALAAG